jgi:long-chain acyl-CoA synthetase
MATYDDVFMKASLIHQSLWSDHKVRKGDRVIVLGNNSIDWVSTLFGSLSCGAIVSPLSPSNKFLPQIISQLQPKVVIDTNPTSQSKGISVTPVHRLTAHTHPKTLVNNNSHDDDIALVLYTSGTSSVPKGVPLSHHNIINNMSAIGNVIGENYVTHTDSSVNFLPWNHCYGITCELLYLTSKGGNILINSDINTLLTDFRNHNPTLLYGVPKLYYKLYNEMKHVPGFFLPYVRPYILGSNIRSATTGGASISKDVIEWYTTKLQVNLCQGYGMTECSPMVSLNPPHDNRIGSVGRLLDNVQVSFGENSEVLIKGSSVFKNYWGGDKIDNWFHTGDKGAIKDGHLYITGRIKEEYKLTNGKYIIPSIVENEILKSKAISQVFVWGADMPYNICLVRTKLSEEEAQREVIRACKNLSPYEIPRKVLLIDTDFTQDNQMLTAKMTLKRETIFSHYQEKIKSLF